MRFGTDPRFHFWLECRSRKVGGILGAGLLVISLQSAWAGVTKSPSAAQKDLIKSPVGALVIERSQFAQKAQLGTIAALEWHRFPQDSEAVLVAVGDRGAALIGQDGTVRSVVRFDHPGAWMVPVMEKKDCEFMNRGGDRRQVGLCDTGGRIIWQYGLGNDRAPLDMAAGDLLGDGKTEFVVGMASDGGIRLLDHAGREKWRQAEVNVWHVEIMDIDGDGKNEIVHSNQEGLLRIRNAEGKVVRDVPTDSYVGFFSPCRWPNSSGKWHIINNNKRMGVQLMDFQGKVVARFYTPDKGQQVYGTPALLGGAKSAYFALVVCDCVPLHDSRFYIYDSDSELVFTEKLPTSRAAAVTIPGETPGTEDLLLGEADGNIWRYHLEHER